jgi:hypothetical protein
MKKSTIVRMSAIIYMAMTCFGSNKATAQVEYIPAAAHPFSLSLGGGFTNMYSSITKKNFQPAGVGDFSYNFTPYISVGIEGQRGYLAEGENDNIKVGPEYSKSIFYAANVNARVGLGQWLDKNNYVTQTLGGLYLGTGVGYLNNSVLNVKYIYVPDDNNTITYKTQTIIVPFNVGLNEDLPIYKMGVNINWQYNFTNVNGLDGFNFNGHHFKDGYSLLSLSICYYFGKI